MDVALLWTLVGGLFTIMIGFMAIMTRMFGTTLDAKFDAVNAVMTAGFESIDRRFEQVDKRFEQVDKRFEQVEKRLDRIEGRVDALDRDVNAITRRMFGGEA